MSKDQGLSVISVILGLSAGPSVDDLSNEQHENALEWFALQLAIRDRQQIVKVMCRRNPDHLTAGIQDGVAAYTPMIRRVHQAVNLSDTVWDFERFVTDMLKMSKPSGPKGGEKPPSVEDYVDLLHRHQGSTHKFLHQVAKNDKEVTQWWYEYVHMAAGQFKDKEKPPPTDAVVPDETSPGGMVQSMEEAFTALPDTDQSVVKAELDAHHKYLHDLHSASAVRISSVIKRNRNTPFGPGAFLARWQHLLDSTPITPAMAKGPVRHGADKGVKEEGRKDIQGDEAGFVTEDEVEKVVVKETPDAPSAEKTLALLGPKFREVLGAG